MKVNIRKLAVAGMMTALGVSLSAFSIPIGASRCFPIQHLLNVLAGEETVPDRYMAPSKIAASTHPPAVLIKKGSTYVNSAAS